jgi:hypothetical protein
MMLLIGLGFCYTKKVGADALLLFESITEFISFMVWVDSINIAKFAPRYVGWLGQSECVPIVLAMRSIGNWLLIVLEYSVRSIDWSVD